MTVPTVRKGKGLFRILAREAADVAEQLLQDRDFFATGRRHPIDDFHGAGVVHAICVDRRHQAVLAEPYGDDLLIDHFGFVERDGLDARGDVVPDLFAEGRGARRRAEQSGDVVARGLTGYDLGELVRIGQVAAGREIRRACLSCDEHDRTDDVEYDRFH